MDLQHYPLALSMAKKAFHEGWGQEIGTLSDIQQEAFIGLQKLLLRLDKSRTKQSQASYLSFGILNHLRDVAKVQHNPIRISSHHLRNDPSEVKHRNSSPERYQAYLHAQNVLKIIKDTKPIPGDYLPGREADPLDIIIRKELITQIKRRIRGLPNPLREIIRLRHIHPEAPIHFSIIAKQLGLPYHKSRSIYFEGMEILKKRLSPLLAC